MFPGWASAETPGSVRAARIQPAYRGWERLVERLKRDGVDPVLVAKVYSDDRLPPYAPVQFNLASPESPALYTDFFNADKLERAERYLAEYARTFAAAEKKYGVSREVVCAILLVETHFGQTPGKHRVIERLSKLASVSEPENIAFNLPRLKKNKISVTRAQLEDRARSLVNLFYPELRALFEIARRERIDIVELRGSVAGAFGVPQFLPSSFLRFAVDGNGDGTISLFDPEDAITSAANYLASFGWQERSPLENKRRVIYAYNHSEPYIDTILALAKRLRAIKE